MLTMRKEYAQYFDSLLNGGCTFSENKVIYHGH